jgi:hypothetical protein
LRRQSWKVFRKNSGELDFAIGSLDLRSSVWQDPKIGFLGGAHTQTENSNCHAIARDEKQLQDSADSFRVRVYVERSCLREGFEDSQAEVAESPCKCGLDSSPLRADIVVQAWYYVLLAFTMGFNVS